MSAPIEGRDVGRTWEGLLQCESCFKPTEEELLRCQLPKGHEGEHEANWEWSDEEDERERP